MCVCACEEGEGAMCVNDPGKVVPCEVLRCVTAVARHVAAVLCTTGPTGTNG